MEETVLQIIHIGFYIVVSATVFLGAFGVYILLKYGEKRSVALSASAVFIVLLLTLLGNSYHSLLNISF